MKIQKVSEAAQNAGVKAVVYGPAGSGKTYSIASIPDHKSVLVLSAEAGLLSIREVAGDIDCVVIDSIDTLREVFAYVDSGEGTKYKTIVLDSLTEIAQQVLAQELGGDDNELKADGTKKKHNPDPRAAYGNMAARVLNVAKSFRDLNGRNVIIICQESRIQDDSARIFYGPSMPGKQVAPALPYLTDLVFALRTKTNEDGSHARAFQTSPIVSPLYIAKDRSGKLEAMEAPNWALIFDKINNKKTEV